MSFKDPRQSLRDIRDAIASVEEFTHGLDAEGFRSDPRTVAALERKLLVISEAAIRLGDQGAVLCPDQPWPKIRGTGNWIRHQYERINIDDLWNTFTDDLPSLKASVARALAGFIQPRITGFDQTS